MHQWIVGTGKLDAGGFLDQIRVILARCINTYKSVGHRSNKLYYENHANKNTNKHANKNTLTNTLTSTLTCTEAHPQHHSPALCLTLITLLYIRYTYWHAKSTQISLQEVSTLISDKLYQLQSYLHQSCLSANQITFTKAQLQSHTIYTTLNTLNTLHTLNTLYKTLLHIINTSPSLTLLLLLHWISPDTEKIFSARC